MRGLRAGGRRIALTLADQVVSSASNFATGVVIARLAGARAFGQYVLTAMIWLVVVGIHRALITEPVIVTSRSTTDRGRLVAQGVTSELMLGGVVTVTVALAAVLALMAGAPIGRLMLALAPWFIPMLVQDYWRAMAFLERRPGLALTNDAVFAIVQIAFVGLFIVIGWRSASSMIVAWGIGSTAGALFGLWWSPSMASPAEALRLVRGLWPMSRWLLADFLSGFAADQAYLVFLALLLTGEDYGGFRAAASLMGPTVVILLAGGNIGLPEASARANTRNPRTLRLFARRLTAGTAGCVMLYGAVVAVGGGQLLSSLYGPRFARFAPLATFAAVEYIILVSVFGQGIALKAAGRMRLVWMARVAVAVASLLSMLLLVRRLGLIGAGWSAVATGVYYAIAVYALYRFELTGTRSAGRGLAELYPNGGDPPEAPDSMPTAAGG
ncbi:MAG: hypothetical protein M3N98_14370 [Actinomycetota bacterium]|nr:hypothetical protein [Actinomycetota bacterium]